MTITLRHYALIAGVNYLIIFFAAIFANFFVLEALKTDPVGTVTTSGLIVRLGIMAFLVAAVCDVIVAWALQKLYADHPFTTLSTYFRLIHAALMAVGLFALVPILSVTGAPEIMGMVTVFNTIWLIGLFFFGAHLLLLGRIVTHITFIPSVLLIAGFMYMVDTTANVMLSDYDAYADMLLLFVAAPAVVGEMGFALWLLVHGGKAESPGAQVNEASSTPTESPDPA